MLDGVVTLMVYNCALAPAANIPKAEAPYTTGASIQAFLNWADNHPERWGDSFSEGVIAAMIETFPCRN